MIKGLIPKIFACMSVFSLCLFSYLEKQNELTELRLYAPKIVREMKSLEEENARLCYEIEQFESPDHLLQLAREARFSHLKHPLAKEVVELSEGLAVNTSLPDTKKAILPKSSVTLAVGAN